MLRFVFVLFLLVGIGNSLPTERVVNGTDAEEGEFPFAASLRLAYGSHSCGCSILTKDWILTAAHCVTSSLPSSLEIQYGVNRISQSGPTVAKVQKIVIHKGYNPSNNYIHDIAVLKLAKPLEFNERVQPVKLPSKDYEAPGNTESILVGWGLDKTGGSIQKNLQKVYLITFSDEDCNKRHGGNTHVSQICGGVPEGGKGQCSGDSGGPLIRKAGREQLGIVSWSRKPCTIAPYPGVYTKVSHYVDWINEQISKE